MSFQSAIEKMEKEDKKKSKDIFLNQAVATIVIIALIIWVAVLFNSYIAIGFLVLIIIIMYSSFVPKKKFR